MAASVGSRGPKDSAASTSISTLLTLPMVMTANPIRKAHRTVADVMTAAISRNIDMEELQEVQRFIGIGEQADDLRPFNADQFVQGVFDE